MSEDVLIEAHNVLDAKYLREVNRSLARTLHDAVFLGGAATIATTRLQSILKTPQAAKTIAGEDIEGEDIWPERPWMMPGMQLWGTLSYRFESMTEIINGAFMDDLGDLLSSITGQQRKTLYEICKIDQEFEKMCELLYKNVLSIKSLMPFPRSSLRQTMIRKLSKVGKTRKHGRRQRST